MQSIKTIKKETKTKHDDETILPSTTLPIVETL